MLIRDLRQCFQLTLLFLFSPVRCEDVFQQSKFIEQIYVHGDSLQSYLVAIVVPNEAVLKQWAVENGLPPMSFDELCSRKDVQQVILEDMAAAALLHKVCICLLSILFTFSYKALAAKVI